MDEDAGVGKMTVILDLYNYSSANAPPMRTSVMRAGRLVQGGLGCSARHNAICHKLASRGRVSLQVAKVQIGQRGLVLVRFISEAVRTVILTLDSPQRATLDVLQV